MVDLRHRFALWWLASGEERLAQEKLLCADRERVLSFLRDEGLRGLAWNGSAGPLREVLGNEHGALLRRAAVALEQHRFACELSLRLREAGIGHAFFKGVHYRLWLHEQPSDRDAVDVDLLVAPEDFVAARELFRKAGLRDGASQSNSLHEWTLRGEHCLVDLHMELLRWGRLRQPAARAFVERAVPLRGLPVLAPTDALAFQLVHAPVVDYVTQRLSHALDLHLMLQHDEVDVTEAAAWVRRQGLVGAAWLMLQWTQSLFPVTLPAPLRQLTPGPLRRAYLGAWLAADPNVQYGHHPLLTRGAFSLWLHDHVSDQWRALRNLGVPPALLPHQPPPPEGR